ncbi:MAG: ABC transporter permease [Pirellulales bacterium]
MPRFQIKAISARFLAGYGMLGVLLLLCAYFSWATLAEQNPGGKDAADLLAAELVASLDKDARVAIIARPSAEDGRFVAALGQRLEEDGIQVVGKIQGDPAAVRRFLAGEATSGRRIDVLATPRDYAAVVANIQRKIPPLARAVVRTPESYLWPTFLLTDNLVNVASQIVVIAIIAVGMTMVIISRGIDLSVGSLAALSAVAVAWLIRWAGGVAASPGQMFLCCVGAVGMCALVGVFSGVMITRFRMPPFIATLAVMQVASGLAYIISEGNPIYAIPDSFVWLGRKSVDFGAVAVPHAVLLMAGIYVAAHVLMARTSLGRYIYAVGGNEEAARLSGIRVNRILIFVYAVSGAMAGIGGVILASQLKSGAPTYGQMYELYVIAAVVVGGTSLAGGEGKILGTLIGAFIIAVIQNGMNLTHVESYTQKVVLGFVILGAVLLDILRKRGWRA